MASLGEMRYSLLTLSCLLIASLPPVAAQNIIPSTPSSEFPACAVSCAVLVQAQTLCVPPAQPPTNQITYENCFCQINLLQALYSTPDAICVGECQNESDRTLLQTWFRNFCNLVGQGIDPLHTTTLATSTIAPESTTVVTITSYSTPATATNTGTGSASAPAPPSNKSWIAGHWQWILMLGILAVGLGLLAWGAIWLRRRHHRKVEQRRAAASGFPTADEKRDGARSATPELWGPHQYMHYTKGWEYHNDPAVLGSGALAGPVERRDAGRSKKLLSAQRKRNTRTEMNELGSRPPASREPSAKGKSRATDGAVQPGSEAQPADRSRSRSQSQRRREPEGDFARVDDPEHQKLLREVRGSRRNQNPDQI